LRIALRGKPVDMTERRWIRNSQMLALLLKYFAHAHIWIYRRTNGRLGARLLWFPAALVTTTGRRTGEPLVRSSPWCGDGLGR